MILRRFMEHIKDQNWFAVGLDVIVVIVGIFLGMQVSDWSEENEKIKSEIRYLNALNQDLNRIDERLIDKIDFERTQTKVANYAYQLLSQKDFSEHKLSIATALSDLTTRRTANFSSPVYIDLLSSGNLTIIRNETLRADIIEYFTFLEARTLILEKNSKQFVDEGFLPLVRNYFSARSDTTAIAEEYDTELNPLPSVEDDDFSELVTTTILEQTDPSLALPNDHVVWQKMRTALSWRIYTSLGDKNAVEEVREKGFELSKKISSYMLSLE